MNRRTMIVNSAAVAFAPMISALPRGIEPTRTDSYIRRLRFPFGLKIRDRSIRLSGGHEYFGRHAAFCREVFDGHPTEIPGDMSVGNGWTVQKLHDPDWYVVYLAGGAVNVALQEIPWFGFGNVRATLSLDEKPFDCLVKDGEVRSFEFGTYARLVLVPEGGHV